MRQYDDVNQGLKSLNQKIRLPEQDQTMIITEINKKMNMPVKKRTPFQWKYYLASAAAILLLVVIAMPLLNGELDLVGGNKTEESPSSSLDRPATINESNEEITISIVNQSNFEFYHMYIKIFQDGVMKQSQGGMNADGSAIESGDSFNFSFEENELKKGLYEIELDMSSNPGVHQENNYTTQRVLLEITEQKDYTLELNGTFINYTYLMKPTMEQNENLQLEKIGFIKESLRVGLSKQAVEKLFPGGYEKVLIESDEREIWRYDFGTIVGYVFNEEHDYGDVAGMQSGTIQAQLFIEWDHNDKILGYTYFYLVNEEKEKAIYSYEMLSDGTERERVVCHTNEEYESWVCPG